MLVVIVVSFTVAVVVVKVKMGFCVEEEEGSLIIIGAVLSWDRWDEGSALCSGGDTRTDPTEPGTKRPLLDRFPSKPRPPSVVPKSKVLLLLLLLVCVSCTVSVVGVGVGKSGESSGRPTMKK